MIRYRDIFRLAPLQRVFALQRRHRLNRVISPMRSRPSAETSGPTFSEFRLLLVVFSGIALLGVLVSNHFRYCSSVTFSIHSTTLPSSFS